MNKHITHEEAPLPATACKYQKHSPPRTLLSLALAICSFSAVDAQTYKVTEIPLLAGSVGSSVVDMNSMTQVVGNSSMKDGRFSKPGPAYFWENGRFATLPPPEAGFDVQVSAISETGRIFGSAWSSVSPGQGYAVYWEPIRSGEQIVSYACKNWNHLLPGTGLRLIQAKETSRDDSDGMVVAFDAYVESEPQHTVVGHITDDSATFWVLDKPLDGEVLTFTAVRGISRTGQIVRLAGGIGRAPENQAEACLWEINLETEQIIRMSVGGVGSCYGTALNEGGQVVGYGQADGGIEGFIWSTEGSWNLGSLAGGARVVPHSINNAGLAVGLADTGGKKPVTRAFVWSAEAGLIDLNKLKHASDTSGVQLVTALVVNESGEILATGAKNGTAVRVILKPVY